MPGPKRNPKPSRRNLTASARGPVPEAPIFGIFRAAVTNNRDPERRGRVKVRIDSLRTPGTRTGRKDSVYHRWAKVATLTAGEGRGTWFMPHNEDEVLVAFEEGNKLKPYVLGAFWNDSATPPAVMDSEGRNKKILLRSKEGLEISLDGSQGNESLELSLPSGPKLQLKGGNKKILIEDGGGNKIEFQSSGITINSPAKVTVNAGQVQVSAGMLTVDAGMSKFSGVVQCDSLITNSVVSASYTPGAGNIW